MYKRQEEEHVLAEAWREGRRSYDAATARPVSQDSQRGAGPNGGQIDAHRTEAGINVVGQQQQAAARRLARHAAPLDIPGDRLGLRRRPHLEAVGGRQRGVGIGGDGQFEDVRYTEVQPPGARAQFAAVVPQQLEPLSIDLALFLPAIPAQAPQTPPAGAGRDAIAGVVVPLPTHHDADAGAVAGAGVARFVNAEDGNGHGDGVVAVSYTHLDVYKRQR